MSTAIGQMNWFADWGNKLTKTKVFDNGQKINKSAKPSAQNRDFTRTVLNNMTISLMDRYFDSVNHN